MGLWSWLTGRENRATLENPRLSLGDPSVWVELFGHKSDSGIQVNPNVAMSIATYWQCVHLLADDFAKLPTLVYKKSKKDDSRDTDTSHPIYYLLRRKPNEYLTSGIFKKTLLSHALTWGNGYARIIRDGGFTPLSLNLLNPERTCAYWNNDQLWYKTWIGNKETVLAPYEVFHLRGVGFDGTKGYGVAEFANNSLGLSLAAEMFGNKHFANGSKASGVLTYPGRLNDKARKNLKESFDAAHQGLENAHKTIVLEDGAKFTPFTIPPNEAQYIQLREFQRKEIGSWFKIPPSKLGDPDSVSYNSLEQWNQAYLESALDPWLVAFEEEAFDKLLTEVQKQRESHFVEFNRAALLRTALADRYRAYATAIQWGWFNVNDIRRLENEPQIGPEGDVYLVPANMDNRKAVVNQTERKPTAGSPAGPTTGKQGDNGSNTDDPNKPARDLLQDTFGRVVRRITGALTKAAKRGDDLDSIINDHLHDFVRIAGPVLDVMAILDPAGNADTSALARRHVDDIKHQISALDQTDLASSVAEWADEFERSAVAGLVSRVLGTLNREGENNAHECLPSADGAPISSAA
jgi:HK97 family phage portal protein